MPLECWEPSFEGDMPLTERELERMRDYVPPGQVRDVVSKREAALAEVSTKTKACSRQGQLGWSGSAGPLLAFAAGACLHWSGVMAIAGSAGYNLALCCWRTCAGNGGDAHSAEWKAPALPVT